MTCIYALVDPFTEDIRYIGKSDRPKGRLRDHLNDRSVNHRTNWLRSLKAENTQPILIILEEVPDGVAWQDAERRWIEYAIAYEWPLTNSTSGGDGVCDLSPESRERLRTAWKGRKHRPETLIKIGNASRGRRHTDEHKQHMRRVMKGREITPAWRRKIGKSKEKLTEGQVRDVRLRLLEGESLAAIARRYDVDPGTVRNIRDGRFYRDVGLLGNNNSEKALEKRKTESFLPLGLAEASS